METCKLHGHEPYAYLKHIFKELPKAENVDQFEALLPWNLDVDSVKEMARAV
ncbi:transposase domain-containing protein [Ketobacter sp. MCCC 1A13808]|uniref:transposase domain-containing protein n=1 Tax=Ketobacter sp. MCCC 1A13808 TaxID=2602738 RepID=UPI0012EBEE59|nr:transposase domain-containing protein [Ketobacter sp. MCCC 1A13808]